MQQKQNQDGILIDEATEEIESDEVLIQDLIEERIILIDSVNYGD